MGRYVDCLQKIVCARDHVLQGQTALHLERRDDCTQRQLPAAAYRDWQLGSTAHVNSLCQTRPTSCSARPARCPSDVGYRYSCIRPSRQSGHRPHGTPGREMSFWTAKINAYFCLLTCNTFKARRISPLDNFSRAALPSAVTLHLAESVTCVSSMSCWPRSSGKGNSPLVLNDLVDLLLDL